MYLWTRKMWKKLTLFSKKGVTFFLRFGLCVFSFGLNFLFNTILEKIGHAACCIVVGICFLLQFSCQGNKTSMHMPNKRSLQKLQRPVRTTKKIVVRACKSLEACKGWPCCQHTQCFYNWQDKGAGVKRNTWPSFPNVWATGCKSLPKGTSCKEFDVVHELDIVLPSWSEM